MDKPLISSMRRKRFTFNCRVIDITDMFKPDIKHVVTVVAGNWLDAVNILSESLSYAPHVIDSFIECEV